MLFLLTGSIQTGKTRWLQDAISTLQARGIAVDGVLAPGVWRERANGFEKLGIDNVLLPQGETIPFARRRDLAQQEGAFDAESQSAKAQMGWEISENAVHCVNEHFKRLAEAAGDGGSNDAAPRLLVVDELGQLELLFGGGLTEAVRLVGAGPSATYPHALVIARDWLLHAAHERFDAVWGDVREINANDEGMTALIGALAGR